MVVLTIDISRPEARVSIVRDGIELGFRQWQVDRTLGRRILEELSQVLDEHNLSMSDLTKIELHQGSDQSSALRAGVVVANFLAYSIPCEIAS